VDGKPVDVQHFVYFLLNKPKDVLCTNVDTHGRKTYLDLLPEMTERVFPVGRLDRDSEGLLFVTNDGELANRLIHPRYEVEKVYQALCTEKLSEQALHEICRGVFSEGDHLSAESIIPIDEPNAYEIRLREGKNRHIRRMIEKTGHEVVRLKRISFGPLTISGIKRGAYRALTDEEVAELKALTATG
jgi:23S rRNA pseudouridine2605 synthase